MGSVRSGTSCTTFAVNRGTPRRAKRLCGPSAGCDSRDQRWNGADHRGSSRGTEDGAQANGAGIAADPTLTGVWMTLVSDASGEPSASSAWGHAWRPMSSLSLPCLAAGLPEICHRRSRRHPASVPACFCVRRPAGAFRSSPARLRICRGFRPFTVHKSCGWGLTPFPLHFRPARFLACPVPSRRSDP
jgi:hypothetical protein